MRLHRARSLPFFQNVLLSTGCVVLATACSIYGGEVPEAKPDGGSAAGAAGTSVAGSGGAAGNGGSAGAGTGGTAGGSGGTGGATIDAATIDADGALTDAAPPRPDAVADSASDASDVGAPTDGGADTLPPPNDVTLADTSDVSTDTDARDAGAPRDVSGDEPRPVDADATIDADSGTRDAVDSGPTGPQILPPHGTPIENPDAGGPFANRCANDEVVTGFVGRAGVQTDAIASTCSRLSGGVLSSPRNLPLNGNLTGGSPFTVVCPANHAAVGIVGRYGHNTMWQEDVTTAIGVVCKNLASTATQIVAISGQPALDAGYTSFREDCTGGRYLTVISGRTDGNSLGFCVQQVGGECNVR